MKIKYSRLIPFKGFYAINLFGVMFIRKEYDSNWWRKSLFQERAIRHESIHTLQMKELLYIGFYILYALEWFVRLFVNGPSKAYESISFEREAYSNERNLTYLEDRKKYSWTKYFRKHE